MNNVICTADIRSNKKTYLIVWYILLLLAGYVIALLHNDGFDHAIWLFCLPVYTYEKGVWVNGWIDHYVKGGGWFKFFDYGDERDLYMWLLCISIFIICVIGIPLIIKAIFSHIEKNSSLKLTESGIEGKRKKLFSSAELKLPIDKVDNIMVRSNVFCALFGGKIVAVSSASGLVKFPWVQNAEEFVNATLAKIEEYKKTIKDDNKSLISAVAQSASAATNSSTSAKVKELKEMLDSGLISQEEFEAKRQELLSKM